MAPQTRKSSARAARKFPFFDQLRPGLLGKVGSDTFLHARTQRVPRRLFPHLHFHILGETFDDLRLVVEQSPTQSSTGFKRMPETWCARFPARFQD